MKRTLAQCCRNTAWQRSSLVALLVVLVGGISMVGCASTDDGGGFPPHVRLSQLRDQRFLASRDFSEYDGLVALREGEETRAANDDGICLNCEPIVVYVVANKEPYDSVFRDAAEINAILTQLDFAITRVQASPGELTDHILYLANEVFDLEVDSISSTAEVFALAIAMGGAFTAMGDSIEEVRAVIEPMLDRSSPIYQAVLGAIRETAFVVEMIGFAGTTIPEVAERAGDILETLRRLQPANDFIGPDALKVPQVIEGIDASIANLETAAARAEQIYQQLEALFTSALGL